MLTTRMETSKSFLLAGEEIHDQDRDPTEKPPARFWHRPELASLADDPQALINAIQRGRGIMFHCTSSGSSLASLWETDISWVELGCHRLYRH